ncbi:MAG: hypothetical protein WA061_02000 [Microgenomates group bacterium]
MITSCRFCGSGLKGDERTCPQCGAPVHFSENIRNYVVKSGKLFDGYCEEFKFPNGYGASVVSHLGTNFEMELAVTKYGFMNKWKIVYDTPITDDVIRLENDEEMEEILKQIKEL